ncbi:DUF92 domain-containing protein [Prochlorococcus marinus]|uniref:DUF92 domain-containing protein n=1 Tax=Prochlorococcus marinus TaxID=1219 RepID=UPI0026C8D14B
MFSSIPLQSEWLIAFSINLILILIAQRLPMLTKSGWLHAGALGTILWGCLGWKGWLSVVVYLLCGSIVTKLGFKFKQSQGIAEARGGRRGPENVWGSAATGTFLAMLYTSSNFVEKEILLIGFAASFSAKLADTFGSEVGKRWGRRTFLITSFKKVKPGTDGAISLEGTLASLLGCFLMTLVMMFLSFVSSAQEFAIVVIAGFISTLVESVIGATIQSRFNWLSNELVNSFQTSFASLIAICTSYLILF